MNDAYRTVLTIGHSAYALVAFVALLQQHQVTAVADVRSAPYSRFNPQFNREPFAEALEAERIRYVYLGRELGGRSDDPSCYENGRISYARLARTERFRNGIARLMRGMSTYRIALVCAEKEPLDCHRTLLVARALCKQGVDVAHIHAGGAVEPHDEAMNRLIAFRKSTLHDTWPGPSGQMELLAPVRHESTRERLIDEAVRRREGRVAHRMDAHVDRRRAVQATEQDA